MQFSDILVAPFDGLLGQGGSNHYHRGGPIWPDWDKQIQARHCQDGKPIDACPPLPDIPPGGWREIDEAQWCGPIHWHFGHMVAEFSMRILPTALNGNRAPLLFGGFPPKRFVNRKHPLQFTKPFFRDIIAYAGVRPRRLVIAGEAVKVGTLHVAPQAEQLYDIGPSAAHLDLLDDHAERMLGPRAPSGPVFISRAGMFARFAGEAYIERIFEAAGIRVIRPEALPLIEQLNIYRNAELVLFAEGSAMHTPQFLGRCFDRVVVFRREEGMDLNAVCLGPRCRALSYRSFLRGVVDMMGPNRVPWRIYALSVVDPGKVCAVMRDIGLPVDHLWDDAAFRAAEERDVADWLDEAQQVQLWDRPNKPASEGPGLRVWDIAGNPQRVAEGLQSFYGDRFRIG